MSGAAPHLLLLVYVALLGWLVSLLWWPVAVFLGQVAVDVVPSGMAATQAGVFIALELSGTILKYFTIGFLYCWFTAWDWRKAAVLAWAFAAGVEGLIGALRSGLPSGAGAAVSAALQIPACLLGAWLLDRYHETPSMESARELALSIFPSQRR